MRPLPAAVVAWCAFAAGCSPNPNTPVPVPSYDPDGMSRSAVQQLDKNGNGTVEDAELDACPGLRDARASIDTNNDKRLSAEELKNRFASYGSGGVGAVGISLGFTLDGAKLTDATVTLTPEPFMGGAVQEATGRTNADGVVTTFESGGQSLPGVAPGVYRISVTKDGTPIPPRFNAQTTLGCEVSAGRGGATSHNLRLTSR